MIIAVATGSKCLLAIPMAALVGSLSLMHTQVLHQIPLLVKCLRATLVRTWLYPGTHELFLFGHFNKNFINN
jgi:hypothetical protein